MNVRFWASVCAIGLVFGPAAFAQPRDDSAAAADLPKALQPLLDAFYGVDEGDLASAQYLLDSMASEEFTTEQWQQVFGAFLADVPFAETQTAYWDRCVTGSEGRLQVKLATLAALYAVEGIVQPVLQSGQRHQIYAHVALPGSFLMYLADGFTEARKGDVFNALWTRLGKEGVRTLSESLRGALTPATYPNYIQFGLLIAEYMPPGPEGFQRVGDMMGQPDHLKQFWIGNSIFLFDEGGLSQQHVASLQSLVRAVPRKLHAVGAIIIPDSTGINPDAQGFTTSVQILYLPATPMGVTTDPGEFLIHVGQPVAPLFTIAAAEQMIYAVQELQFEMNPNLLVRRDSILAHAKWNYEAYIRRDFIVPIETYGEDPDTFLPSVAVLWFIDSERTFAIAKDLFQLSMNPAMDSVLLLADMLSAGGGSAPTFRTDLSGQVHTGTCQIARTHVTRVRVPREDRFNQGGPWQPADLYLPSGIRMGAYAYEFDLNDYGGTHRLHPLHDSLR